MSLEALFWAKVWRCTHRDCKRCCWPWRHALAYAVDNGLRPTYGHFRIPPSFSYKAHRFAYALTIGALLLPFHHRLDLCHRCDFPPCCNPAHLWLGTHKENMHGLTRKARQRLSPSIILPNNARLYTNRHYSFDDLRITLEELEAFPSS